MNKMFIVGLAALWCTVVYAGAVAADYWPLHPDGVVYHYDSHTATYSHSGDFTTIQRETPSGCHMGEQYVEQDGRVAICGISSYCPGDFETALTSFDPPLPITPVDPTPGSAWLWESNQWRYPYERGPVLGQVIGEETITVPAGTFTCLHIRLTSLGGTYHAEFYLDRELGPVIWNGALLASIDGMTPTEAMSWGEIKSLFR